MLTSFHHILTAKNNNMENQLLLPDTTVCVNRTGSKIINAGLAYMNGFRLTNEDSHLMHSPSNNECGRYIFGIFDGHSGSQVSQFLPEAFREKLLSLPENLDDQDDAIKQAFIDIDIKIIEYCYYSGSTAAIVILDVKKHENTYQYKCTICNVGDSRVIICRDGSPIFITVDHKPSSPTEKTRIENDGGFVKSGRVDGILSTSRSFGDARFKKNMNLHKTRVTPVPDITHVPLFDGDVIVIVCDGIFERNFHNEAIVQYIFSALNGFDRNPRFIQHPIDLACVATCVCKHALTKKSKDNLSNIIIRIGDNGLKSLELFGPSDCIPGYSPINNVQSQIDAYDAMAENAGFTIISMLQRRKFLLKNRESLYREINLKEIYYYAYKSESKDLIEKENLWFAKLPDVFAEVKNPPDDSIITSMLIPNTMPTVPISALFGTNRNIVDAKENQIQDEFE